MPETAPHYVVTWRDARTNDIVSVRARKVGDSPLGLVFVSISDFVWETRSAIVNPTEDALARRFEHTKALHLSVHAIVSIEEVGPDHGGLTFEADRSKVVPFSPGPDKRL
jgi:hypothetical protein